MTAKLLDGKLLAARIEENLRAEVSTFSEMVGRRPRLAVVLVGDLAASASYVAAKRRAAERVGIDSLLVERHGRVETHELVELVEELARDEQGPVDGILVQLPLPPRVDAVAVLDAQVAGTARMARNIDVPVGEKPVRVLRDQKNRVGAVSVRQRTQRIQIHLGRRFFAGSALGGGLPGRR